LGIKRIHEFRFFNFLEEFSALRVFSHQITKFSILFPLSHNPSDFLGNNNMNTRQSRMVMLAGTEISILVILKDSRIQYKVTKRIPVLSISETRIIESKRDVVRFVSDLLD